VSPPMGYPLVFRGMRRAASTRDEYLAWSPLGLRGGNVWVRRSGGSQEAPATCETRARPSRPGSWRCSGLFKAPLGAREAGIRDPWGPESSGRGEMPGRVRPARPGGGRLGGRPRAPAGGPGGPAGGPRGAPGGPPGGPGGLRGGPGGPSRGIRLSLNPVRPRTKVRPQYTFIRYVPRGVLRGREGLRRVREGSRGLFSPRKPNSPGFQPLKPVRNMASPRPYDIPRNIPRKQRTCGIPISPREISRESTR